MQTIFAELAEPWRGFPKIVGFYAIASVFGALALVLVHVFLPAKQQLIPTKADHEQKALPYDSPIDKKSDVISRWEALRSTDDIVELNRFITQFPGSPYADAAWDRMNRLIQNGALKVAGETEGLEILSNVLQHDKDKSAATVRSIINYYGFDKKYPLGFALFYSDGSRVLYYSDKIDRGSNFDPEKIKILRITPSLLCFSGFEWKGAGPDIIMDNNCVGGAPGSLGKLLSTDEFTIWFESLGVSPHGAGWVIGIGKPDLQK